MNLNQGQVLSITIVVLGVLVASTSQLNTLFGQHVTADIVSASTILMSILAGINTILQSQGSQVAAVLAEKGVEKLLVNKNANPTLAALAVSNAPENAKIEATPEAAQAVQATASAAS